MGALCLGLEARFRKEGTVRLRGGRRRLNGLVIGAKASKMFSLQPNLCRRVESQWNSNGQRRPYPKLLDRDRLSQLRQPSRPLFQQQRHQRRQVKRPLTKQALPKRRLLKRRWPILKTVVSQLRRLSNQESAMGEIHRYRKSSRKRNDNLLTVF